MQKNQYFIIYNNEGCYTIDNYFICYRKEDDKMLMEIYLSEEKAKKNNIDLESCYQKINRYFLDHGVKIKSPGVYQGVKEDFNTFAVAQGQLPQTNWFLKIVDQWYICYFGDTPDSPEYREDALKIYYKAKSQVKEYVRKQKGA